MHTFKKKKVFLKKKNYHWVILLNLVFAPKMEVISKSVAIVIIMKIITHTHCNTVAPQDKKEGHYYKLS